MSEFHYFTLNNGIRIVHRNINSSIVYTGLMVGAGTRDELPSQNGLAHYIEHCVFKGTEHFSARRILNLTERIGGEVNAYTTKEETTFYATTLREHFTEAVSLLSDMVLHPTFPKAETDKELGVILDEIETYNDSPSELIYDDFENLLFTPHPLGLPILGTKRSLRRLTADDAHAYMARNYQPEQIVFFCLGHIDFKKVIRTAERYLGDAVSKSAPRLRTAPEIAIGGSQQLRKRTHQTHVMLGGEASKIGSTNQAATLLLANIIGGSSSNSMLNLALRERTGLVYTIDANYTPMSDTGYWAVYFATEEHHTEQCMELVDITFARLREKPLNDTALRRYKQQMMCQMAIAAENNENAALSMAKSMLYRNYANTWKNDYQKIENVSATELQQVANELLAKEKVNTLMYC